MLTNPLNSFAVMNVDATDASITTNISNKLSNEKLLSGTSIDVKTVKGNGAS